jgi:glycosyltransferase involved in cell wall biosynthesis
MQPRRLFIADPGLTGLLGHHLGYSQSVAEAALRVGIAPVVLAGEGFAGLIAGGAIPSRATFRARYRNTGGGGAARRLLFAAASHLPNALAGVVAPPLRLLRQRLAGQIASDTFAAELATVLTAEAADASDAVVLHTVSAANLFGMLEVPAPEMVGEIWLVLRRAPEEMDLDDAAPQPILQLLVRLASRFGERLVLFADTEPLAAIFHTATGLPVAPVPLPIVIPDVPARPGRVRPNVVFAGGARGEKGYRYLPAAIAACRDRARFTVQAGTIGPNDDPLVQRAHRALQRMAGPDLILIEGGLDPEAYLALLADADLLFLPYDAAAYGPRSSGILGEALALGIPAVVPSGCWMADAAGEDRAVLIRPDRPPAAALDAALQRLPALTEAAQAGAPAWRARHNPNSLLGAFLAGATPPKVAVD